HPTVLRSMTRLLPGVAETLRTLREAGLRLAVCSNKPKAFTIALLDILDIANFFQAVIGPEDAPKPKPAPEMLLAALKALSVLSSHALYVGDMTVDIETARTAHVKIWALPTGTDSAATLAAAAPDRLLGSFQEIGDLVSCEW